jgi:hypothetical protein
MMLNREIIEQWWGSPGTLLSRSSSPSWWTASPLRGFVIQNSRRKVMKTIKTINSLWFDQIERRRSHKVLNLVTRMTIKYNVSEYTSWQNVTLLRFAATCKFSTFENVRFCGKHIFYFLWAEKKSETFFQISRNNTPGALQSSRESVQ